MAWAVCLSDMGPFSKSMLSEMAGRDKHITESVDIFRQEHITQ